MKLHFDFESRSRIDLKNVGLWAYALHPSTEPLCLGWAPHGGPVTVLTADELRAGPQGSERCRALVAALTLCESVGAHNAPFEYAIWNLILHRRYGWPALWEPTFWDCTMARALACGLPGDLDGLGRVLRIKTPKDIEGRKVMLRSCKPVLNEGKDFDETPALLERLYAYNATDVQAEMEIDELLPALPAEEKRVWALDLVVNRRGVQIDVDFAARAAGLSTQLVAGLDAQLKTLTGGEVDKATQVAALKYYLKDAWGIERDSLDKENVTDLLLDPTLPDQVQKILSVRRQVGKKNSVAKYSAAVAMACPDGRARGLLQYHAAHTGRWGGRGLQPQNFPKGWDKPEQQAEAIAHIMNGGVDCYGDRAMDALSDSLRGVFIAAPGKSFVCADFNAIEARVLFWLAGEEGALNAYRRGESPYLEMACVIYNREDLSKHGTPQEYDIGKRTILGCGYGMGHKKFRDNIYAETAKKGKPVLIPTPLALRAVQAYRDKYPFVRNLWYEVERAAIEAVRDSRRRAHACAGGRVLWGMSADRRFLGCRLPSGRFLRYFMPEVVNSYRIFCEDPECVHWKNMDDATCPTRKPATVLSYAGVNPYTNQWGRVSTYGGALVENITQATARDLLAHGMLAVEAAGYRVVLTVHDEVLAEVEGPQATMLADFIRLMTTTPAWALGCPVAAEGWAGDRYHK